MPSGVTGKGSSRSRTVVVGSFSELFSSEVAAVSSEASEDVSLSYASLQNNRKKLNQDQAFAMEIPMPDAANFVVHCQKALTFLSALFQEFCVAEKVHGGTTLTGAAVVGSQGVLFNAGDSKTVVEQKNVSGVSILHETKEHKPHLDLDAKIDNFAVHTSQHGINLVPSDFTKESVPYEGLEFFERHYEVAACKGFSPIDFDNINKIPNDVRWSCPGILHFNTAVMRAEDKAELLFKLGQRQRTGGHAYYRLCVAAGFALLEMTRSLGDNYPNVCHDLEFTPIRDLTPGDYFFVSMTDGVTAVCQEYPGDATRIELKNLLENVLSDSSVPYAKALCDLARDKWVEYRLGTQDDISAGVIMHTVSSVLSAEETPRAKIVFVADGHGSEGATVSLCLKLLLEHFLVPCVQFLQAPSQEKLDDLFMGISWKKINIPVDGLRDDKVSRIKVLESAFITFLNTRLRQVLADHLPSTSSEKESPVPGERPLSGALPFNRVSSSDECVLHLAPFSRKG